MEDTFFLQAGELLNNGFSCRNLLRTHLWKRNALESLNTHPALEQKIKSTTLTPSIMTCFD